MFTLLKAPTGHYALYENEDLVATWVPSKKIELKPYIDSQIAARNFRQEEVVEADGTFPWAPKLPKAKTEKVG